MPSHSQCSWSFISRLQFLMITRSTTMAALQSHSLSEPSLMSYMCVFFTMSWHFQTLSHQPFHSHPVCITSMLQCMQFNSLVGRSAGHVSGCHRVCEKSFSGDRGIIAAGRFLSFHQAISRSLSSQQDTYES